MKSIVYIGAFLFCLIGHVQAQRIDRDFLVDSIKADITQFFIREGLLDRQKAKDTRDYVFATEIKQKRSIGYDTNGIYRIGVFQSHSPLHILIKQNNEFRIFNLEEINKVLQEVINYSEKNKIGVEFMFVYLKEVMGMYQGNHQTGNLKVKKMK